MGWLQRLLGAPARGGPTARVPWGRARLPDGRRAWVWGFELDVGPVTNRDWRDFMAATGCPRPPWISRPGFDDPDQPVVGVTLAEARAFAAWAQKRLPCRAEWWRAVGGDDGRPHPWGLHSPEDAHAVFKRPPTAAPQPAVGRAPGPYGHNDLFGNVWEWCDDGVCRGGFWGSKALTPAQLELRTDPASRSAGIGLRCAR